MPVINPWLIYLVDLLGKINILLIAGLILSAMALLFLGVAVFFKDDNLDVGDGISVCRLLAKTCCIFLVLLAVIPSKNTALGMVIARQVTVEKVDISKEIIKNIYKEILEAIKK
ncbi:MAG: hypothetical protein ACRCZ0_02830 [Cetobacterium sp.]